MAAMTATEGRRRAAGGRHSAAGRRRVGRMPSDLGAPRTQLDGADDQGDADGGTDPGFGTGKESIDVEEAPDAHRRSNGLIVDAGSLPGTPARIVLECLRPV